MPVITIFSGTFCREEIIIDEICAGTGCRKIGDHEIVSEASRLSGMPAGKIGRVFSAKGSVFNKFTHERERSLAYLKLALAQALSGENLLIEGFSAMLTPIELKHVLRICLIADLSFRISVANQSQTLEQGEAAKLIRRQDEERAAWVHMLMNRKDPWDPALYDILIPTDKTRPDRILTLVRESLGKEIFRNTPKSRAALDEFLLASKVEVALAQEGHHVGVAARAGDVTLTINKHVLMLSRLEDELKAITRKVPGVKDVATKVGPAFYQTDIYRKFDFELPSKILLVDDEREFVETLSERLSMRDMGSAVAYDGESALELIKEDEPDVMILDLRMPGIDGIEVLRRVKAKQPEIEVIILTGHGSDADRDICMSLGAFAYLQKPVDIELLSETIQKANEKIRLRKKA
jgi:two-component system, OmpR family, response regulator CpxR